jgi:hypothetical protein
LTVRRQAATGNNAVQVRVELERLAPGVEQGDEAYFGTKMTGISGDGAQGCAFRSIVNTDSV